MIGTPIQNYSLSELNGADEAKEGDPRCFIASAAFGSPFNRHVDIFRWARDEFLETSSLGHKFVEFYYNHSQPFADIIKASPVLQKTVRFILYPIAYFLYALQKSFDSPLLSTILLSVFLSFVFIWKRRRSSF